MTRASTSLAQGRWSRSGAEMLPLLERGARELAGADAREAALDVPLELAVFLDLRGLAPDAVVDGARAAEIRRPAEVGGLAERQKLERRHGFGEPHDVTRPARGGGAHRDLVLVVRLGRSRKDRHRQAPAE